MANSANVKIRVLDQDITVDQAREIFNELAKLFKQENTPIPWGPVPYIPNKNPYPGFPGTYIGDPPYSPNITAPNTIPGVWGISGPDWTANNW